MATAEEEKQALLHNLKNTISLMQDRGVEALLAQKTRKGSNESVSSANSAEDTLKALREEIGDCQRCGLCKQRTKIVFGVGNPKTQLMFIGEGPGHDEDLQGEPFVGRAGQLLTKIIEAMGIKRSDVFIANVVKCRPPENRAPLPDEVATCIPFLHRQIEAIQPKVIVCLGATAYQHLLQTESKISQMRGHWQNFNGIKVMPTYHPAFLLRNPNMKRPVWDDMKLVMQVLNLPSAGTI